MIPQQMQHENRPTACRFTVRIQTDASTQDIHHFTTISPLKKDLVHQRPHIYTTAAGVYLEDGLIMRPLSYGFTEDKNTWDIFDQYLFGDALMVCPVTRPMLFGEGADGKMERRVYLPAGTCWYDFYSGKQYEGGQWITAEAPLERIPVFARAGAIIPAT